MSNFKPEEKIKLADTMGVRHNDAGTEFYGMAEGTGWSWMCVFHSHDMCVASECECGCHVTKDA